MIESTESRTRDIPVWLTALVLLLCIGGGSWLVYWTLRDRPREVVVVPDDKNAAGQTRTGFKGTSGGNNSRNSQAPRDTRNLNADGVAQLSKNTYRVKSGNTAMNVSYTTGRLDFSTLYLSLRTAEQAQLAIMRVSIIQDSNWREYLKVSQEQIDKLMKVPQAAGMKLDPADRARLTTLWNAYHEGAAANKPAAEKALVAALDEIGKKNLEATKQEEVARAEAIRSALTAEQLKLYLDSNTGGTRAPVPPKAKPAALAPAAAAKPDRTTADLAALHKGPATTK